LYDSESVDPETNRRLAQVLGTLAVEMQAQADNSALLSTIVHSAVDIVEGARWAGVSLVVKRQRVIPEVPADSVSEQLDQLHTDLGEGPSLSVLADHQTVQIHDLSAEARWPRFASTAMELGVHSLLAFRLFVRSGDLGVLNLYGATANAFTEDSVLSGEVLAQHAAVAMVGASAAEQFRTAVYSRDLIGQAKGILMHRDRLTGLQAFAALTLTSQETNIKLVNVARWLVEDHESRITE
jgi:transcriptional regulator with GAF, ATPase, and Fis domain